MPCSEEQSWDSQRYLVKSTLLQLTGLHVSARFIQIELWPEMGQQMWKLKDCPVKISGLMISIFKTKDDHLTCCGVAVLLFPSFNLNLIGHFLSKGDFLIRKAITSSLPFTILKKLNRVTL